MKIKRGNVVSHTGAHEWGVGKVLEVTDLKATIQFSDGIIRKIASSHYTTLQPAARASFVAHTAGVTVVTSRANPAKPA
jgi:transcription elongation factor GreA-like protein